MQSMLGIGARQALGNEVLAKDLRKGIGQSRTPLLRAMKFSSTEIQCYILITVWNQPHVMFEKIGSKFFIPHIP